jgi:hypothetical protein
LVERNRGAAERVADEIETLARQQGRG